MSKVFKAYNIKGKLQEFYISDDEELSNYRCPRCGYYVVWSSDNWGASSYCKVCGNKDFEYYKETDHINRLKTTIQQQEQLLEQLKDLLNVVTGKVDTHAANSKLKEKETKDEE